MTWDASLGSGPGAAAQRTGAAAEWSRVRVRNLLLGLGVLLLAVAAVIFAAVNWGVLGPNGHIAVLTAAAGLAASAATFAAHKSLTATAESMAVLALVMLAVTAGVIRRSGLFGAGSVAPSSYAAGALLAIVLITLAWQRVLPLRTPRLAAALGAQGVLPLGVVTTAASAHDPAAVAAAALTMQAAVMAGIEFIGRGRPTDLVSRWVARVGGCAAWAVGAAFAVAGSYGHERFSLLGPLDLIGLAALAALAGRLVLASVDGDAGAGADIRPFGQLELAAATACALLAAAVFVPRLAAVWRAPAVEALAVAGLALVWVVPRKLRQAPELVLTLLAVGAAATAVVPEAQALGAPGTWLRSIWSVDWTSAAHTSARELVGSHLTWSGGPLTGLLFLTVLAGAALMYPRYRGPRAAVVIAVLVVLGVPLFPLAVGVALPWVLAWELAVGCAASLVGAWRLARQSRPGDPLGTVCVAGGWAILVHAALWSLAVPVLTVVTLAGVLTACVAALVIVLPQRAARNVLLPVAVVLAVLESAASACYQGTTVAQTGVVLALEAALIAAIGMRIGPRSDPWAGPPIQVIGLVVGLVSVGLAATGPVAAIAAISVLIAVAVPAVFLGAGPLTVAWALVLEAGTGTDAAMITHRLSPGAPVLWLALLGAGVACGLVALRLRAHAFASAPLLLASSWDRLADARVHAVEPYTLPCAVILLAVGFARRRRDQTIRSWPAYAAGLTLGLLPSLGQGLAGPGLIRPALVGLAALVVVLVGAWRRLQAPLTIGAAVLAVDALAQAAPYLASAYDTVPRWVLIALAGAVLLVLGATYERRIRQLRSLYRQYTELR